MWKCVTISIIIISNDNISSNSNVANGVMWHNEKWNVLA